ncbi:MAG: N-acetyltransferase family protein [Candidatus Njordarchaeum guaymaensis]
MTDMGDLSIREAKLDDCMQIVKVHISDINDWLDAHNEFTAQYKSLDVTERWMRGGPWMSIETCAIHINNFILKEYKAYVAVLNEKIVGEIEVIPEHEPDPYNKNLYIYVFWIHKNFRGRGIGSNILSHISKFARNMNLNSVITYPEEGSMNFYIKNGFKMLEKYVQIKLLPYDRRIDDVSIEEVPIKTLENIDTSRYYFIIGRYGSSSSMLFNIRDDRFFLPKVNFKYKVYQIAWQDYKAYLVIRKSNIMKPSLYTWIKCDTLSRRIVNIIVKAAAYLANREGLKEIHTCIREDFIAFLNKEFVKIIDGKDIYYYKRQLI